MHWANVALMAAPLLLCPLPVLAQATATPTYEVARPGDSQLSCAALISEMNIGSQQIQTGSARMRDRTDRMTASATREAPKVSAAQTVAGMVAGFVPGAGLALGAAQTLTAASRPPPQQPPGYTPEEARGLGDDAAAMSAMVPVGQRFEHLNAIFQNKGC